MDYKFKIKAYQQAAGDENAKISITDAAGNVVGSNLAIISTDADSPDQHVVEVTGLDAPADDNTTQLTINFENEYYVDASTDRNVIITAVDWIEKADGISYKFWDKDTSALVEISDTDIFVSEKTSIKVVTAIAGNDQPDNYTAGDFITVWSGEPVTLTLSLSKGDYR